MPNRASSCSVGFRTRFSTFLILVLAPSAGALANDLVKSAKEKFADRPTYQAKVFPTPAEHKNEYKNLDPKWNHVWSGNGIPASFSMPYHSWWDQPFGDDDFRFAPGTERCGLRFNEPQNGQVTMDNIKTASGRPCPLSVRGEDPRTMTGGFSKRDVILDNSQGITFEFKMMIPRHIKSVQDDAVRFYLINKYGNMGVAFSWNCVKAGPISFPASSRHSCVSAGAFQAKQFDTSKFRVYRIVTDSVNLTLDVYADNTLLISAKGNEVRFVRPIAAGKTAEPGNLAYDAPYIFLGDPAPNRNPDRSRDDEVVKRNEDVSGAFVLDYIRYRVGKFAPSTNLTSAPARAVPEFKKNPRLVGGTLYGIDGNQTLSARAQAFAANEGLTGTPVEQVGRFDNTGKNFVADPKGSVLRLKSAGPAKNWRYRIVKPEGIVGNDGWEFATRIKLGPESTRHSYSLFLMDQVGAVELVLSPGFVQLQIGKAELAKSIPVYLNTDEFHTYTVVRNRGEATVSLYVDNIPTPAIIDFKMGMSQLNETHSDAESASQQMTLTFGAMGHNPYLMDQQKYASQVTDVYLDWFKWRKIVQP